MRYICFLFSLVIYYTVIAQNLVPNPSFERYNTCGNYTFCKLLNPNSSHPCYSNCCFWALPEGPSPGVWATHSATYNWWTVTPYQTPFYFNSCIVNKFIENTSPKYYGTYWYIPRTGNAYIMIFTYAYWYSDTTSCRSYAQVKLTEPLKAGCVYELSCYQMLSRNLNTTTSYFLMGDEYQHTNKPADGLGMFVSKDSIYSDYNQQFSALTRFVPQVSNPSGNLLSDSMNYQKISGTYTANGGEQWLVIGNFKDNAHTQVAGDRRLSSSAYSIDDVSVELWKPDLIPSKDTTVCSLNTLVLSLPIGLKDFQWSTGENTQSIKITNSGTYTVSASNGCETLYDTIHVHIQKPYTNPFSIGKDTFFCSIPNPHILSAPAGFNTYQWSNGDTTNQIRINKPGTYWLQASYICGTLSDTIQITEFHNPDTLFIPKSDTSLCSNQTLILMIADSLLYTSFNWNNGSTSRELFVNQPGIYSVKALSTEGCMVTDSINIRMIYPPVFNTLPDTLVCESLTLNVSINSSNGNKIRWFDGSTSFDHSFTASGTYWMSLFNSCYTVTDTIHIQFMDCALTIPNLITTNSDGYNDYFQIKTNIQRPLQVSIYNSWGNKVFEDSNYKNEWNATGLSEGIYFYQVTDTLLHKNYKGWLQVIR